MLQQLSTHCQRIYCKEKHLILNRNFEVMMKSYRENALSLIPLASPASHVSRTPFLYKNSAVTRQTANITAIIRFRLTRLTAMV